MDKICNISYSDMLSEIKNYSNKNAKSIKISILRNVTIEPVFDSYLAYFLSQIGYTANVQYGEFNNIMEEALGFNQNLLNEQTEYVLVALHFGTLSSKINEDWLTISDDEKEYEKDRVLGYINKLIEGIKSRTSATIFLLGFESSIWSISDTYNNPRYTIEELNNKIKEMAKQAGNVYFIDTNFSLIKLGYERFYDSRYWYIGHAPYSKEACKDIAFECFKYIRLQKGKSKKCIILDCDNVLWGGICGEEALGGIQLGKVYPGNMYCDFQLEVKKLYEAGVIIALCSKNNEEDVWNVFRNHPDMVLSEKNISAYRINWDNKAKNIISLSEELNIGLDSIVFVDDNEHEVELVNKKLPDVETILFDKQCVYKNREILALSGLFKCFNVTAEDKIRGKMYREDKERSKMLNEFDDLTSYYKELEMDVKVFKVDEFYVPRVSQLTQRTNQFNLTTKRYTEADIKSLMDKDDTEIICIKLSDKFGEFGVIGCGILKYCDNDAIIDTFLLSCRALGKHIQDVFLMEVMNLAKQKGMKRIIAKYLPSKKNSQVREFLDTVNFTNSEEESDGRVRYEMDLERMKYEILDIFHDIENDIFLV